MTKYLAGVLTVIAAGVVAIAYGLLAPGVAASYGRGEPMVDMSAMTAPEQKAMMATPPMSGASLYAVPASMLVPVDDTRAMTAPAPTVRARPVSVRRVETPKRDWKKTALLIGGSSAAGAGLGGIFGGKKGALIGAAIGGGASTIYETTKH